MNVKSQKKTCGILEDNSKPSTSNPQQISVCPVCSSSRLHPKAVAWKDGSFTLCGSCGFLFQDPPPSAEASKAFYEKDYYTELKALEGRIREARKPLYAQVLDQLKPYQQNRRLLDVGAGFGDFMKAARDAGWVAWGLEPSFEACEEGRRIFPETLICGTSDEAQFESGFFDAITLWNVVDCLPDPQQSLSRLRKWLRPGGCLFIRTPNTTVHVAMHRFFLAFQPLCSRIGWKKDPAVFLRSNFSARAMRCFLKQTGFSAVSLTNGELTQGDPYGIVQKTSAVTWMKRGFTGCSKALEWLSGGRWFLGTNFLIFAVPLSDAASSGVSLQAKAIALRIKLKTAFLHMLAVLGYLTGLPLWIRLFQKQHRAAVLLYHSVTSQQPGEMSVSTEAFRKQMEFLKNQFELVSLEDAIQGVSLQQSSLLSHTTKGDKARVAITFDDGYEDNFTQAYPILRELNIPAAIFLLAGDERNAVHFGHAQAHYPEKLLSWAQIEEMAAGGIIFGSHGESHSRLGTLSTQDLELEVSNSKRTIEKRTGKSVVFFSYPYGTAQDFDSRAVSVVRQAGYRAAFSAEYGELNEASDLFALKRINVECGDTLFTLRAKLNGALSWLELFHWRPLRSAIRFLDRLFLRMSPRRNKTFEPVLLASVDFPPHTDGVSTIAGALARKISARRPDVFVLGPSDEGAERLDAKSHYQAVRVPGYDWGYARMLPFAPAMVWLILSKGIRRVLALNIAYGGIIAWILSYPLKLKYVLFAYGYEFEKVRSSAFVKKWYQRMYARAEKVICCSEAVRRRLIDFGVAESKAELIYPAVDLDRYQPAAPRADFMQRNQLVGKRIVLTVGRLVERKGHDQVLRALKLLIGKYPDVLYCISGKGSFETRLKEIVHELGLENYVRFMGRVPDEDLRDLYNACEFFIMPSREIEANGHIEGFGIVFLEANAFGKPVIGGHSGGVAEAVQDGISGLLADPHSPDDIALKMETLLANPSYAKQLGQTGLERLRTRFHWEGYAQRTYKILIGEDLP